MSSWKKYYDKTPLKCSKNLGIALRYFPNNTIPKTAVDFGCGNGRDTLKLLSEGFNTVAIDSSIESIKMVSRLTSDSNKKKLIVNHDTFEKCKIPQNFLFNANLSIPFCSPKHFKDVWEKIEKSININGLFVGNFLGNKDQWKNDVLTFRKNEILELFDEFEFIYFGEEEYKESSIQNKKYKNWHIFNVIAVKISKPKN